METDERNERREVRAVEVLDAIRLAVQGAADDKLAVMVIRALLADAPPPDRYGTASAKRLLRAVRRVGGQIRVAA